MKLEWMEDLYTIINLQLKQSQHHFDAPNNELENLSFYQWDVLSNSFSYLLGHQCLPQVFFTWYNVLLSLEYTSVFHNIQEIQMF